jgi:hypothetical protein
MLWTPREGPEQSGLVCDAERTSEGREEVCFQSRAPSAADTFGFVESVHPGTVFSSLPQTGHGFSMGALWAGDGLLRTTGQRLPRRVRQRKMKS